MEVWRQISTAPDYEVSDLGRVRSKDRTIKTSNGQTRSYTGRVLRPSFAHGGYPQVNLRRGGKIIAARTHCLVSEAFIGPRPDGYEVCHCDGNPANCNVDNLRYDTPKGNAADKARHGTKRTGERHPGAKLSAQEVSTVRRGLSMGIKQKDLAAAFGVCRSTIGAISAGRSWNE